MKGKGMDTEIKDLVGGGGVGGGGEFTLYEYGASSALAALGLEGAQLKRT